MYAGFGADPFLSGAATSQTIRGVQSAGVAACVKHLIGNEQVRNCNSNTPMASLRLDAGALPRRKRQCRLKL